MTILASLLANWRWGLMGLIAAVAGIFAWQANGWRLEAAQAKIVRAELRHELERRVQADVDRHVVQRKLTQAESRIGTGVKIITKTVRENVQSNVDCDTDDPVAGMLNRARSGELPTAASVTPDR